MVEILSEPHQSCEKTGAIAAPEGRKLHEDWRFFSGGQSAKCQKGALHRSPTEIFQPHCSFVPVQTYDCAMCAESFSQLKYLMSHVREYHA